MKQSFPSESLEFLRVTMQTNVDPTDSSVAFALTATDADPVTWTSGSWEDDAVLVAGKYTSTARVLIGPGGALEPAEGEFAVWVRVTATPEQPVRRVGVIRIT